VKQNKHSTLVGSVMMLMIISFQNCRLTTNWHQLPSSGRRTQTPVVVHLMALNPQYSSRDSQQPNFRARNPSRGKQPNPNCSRRSPSFRATQPTKKRRSHHHRVTGWFKTWLSKLSAHVLIKKPSRKGLRSRQSGAWKLISRSACQWCFRLSLKRRKIILRSLSKTLDRTSTS
jgi:hypothetical protein